jgi:anti-sigma regulatory factor (Ser/Thr protein kinase)
MEILDNFVITIPDVLGGVVDKTDLLYTLISTTPTSKSYEFDMDAVNFIYPYGIISLMLSARLLAYKSGKPVMIRNVRTEIQQYLQRMNVNSAAKSWIKFAYECGDEWARNPSTQNLLELTVVKDQADILSVVSRTENVFSRWLIVSNLRELLTAVSELCTNIIEHSQDSNGCILIQKYNLQSTNQVKVILAVGDIGIGIRGSLLTRFNRQGLATIQFLHKAMEGNTSRLSGRGGLGLRTVEKIAAQNGGYLWLRSESAAILSRGETNRQEQLNLAHIPGTQVVIEFKAPLLA